jgi:acetyltransferase-like isoleucine patch superfamily enzyme
LNRDHRPYCIKKAYINFEKFYVRHFLEPHFTRLGDHFSFVRPWHVQIFGSPIVLGSFSNVIGAPDAKVKFTVWAENGSVKGIHIGDYSLICPGVRLSSALEINIGDSCMLANGVMITDTDWHGIYNRVSTGLKEPVNIGSNVWIGDSAIICKGVHIGDNAIVGAGAVVASHVPANTIFAGNPARKIRELDPDQAMKTRKEWLPDFFKATTYIEGIERQTYRRNTFLHYLRTLLFPRKED